MTQVNPTVIDRKDLRKEHKGSNNFTDKKRERLVRISNTENEGYQTQRMMKDIKQRMMSDDMI